MKIYRYISNGENYDVIDRTVFGRWWPEGIDMGEFMDYLYPKSDQSNDINTYYCQNVDSLPDFPGFALNCPVVSERAADILNSHGLISSMASILVSGRIFYAIQPALTTVDKSLTSAFIPNKSEGLKLSTGDVFHYYSRDFDITKLSTEFFTIPEFEPFSELFITERIVEVVKEQQLTGLENIELVYDDAPVQPQKLPLTDDEIQALSYRRTLEFELYQGRATMMAIDSNAMESAVIEAMKNGFINFNNLS